MIATGNKAKNNGNANTLSTIRDMVSKIRYATSCSIFAFPAFMGVAINVKDYRKTDPDFLSTAIFSKSALKINDVSHH